MKTHNQTHRRRAACSAALIACLCAMAPRPAAAGTVTWNGGATPDGNWLTPGNWNGVAPKTNDLLVFTGGTQTATTNNYSVNTPFNNLSFSGGAGAFTLNGNGMILSSPTDAGSGQITGGSINSASAGTETIRLPMVLANGNHTISSGSGTLRLNGSITRSNGAVLTMSGNINVTGSLSTNGSANGILGGWAVCSNNWATLDANSNVVAYAGYTDVAANGAIPNNPSANVRILNNSGNTATAALPASTTTINSLLFGGPTASTGVETLTMGAGNKLVLGQNGGIFNNTGVAGAGTYRTLNIGASVAQGGILTAGDGVNPATINFGSAPLPNASGFCTVHASIQDNGSAPVTVVVAGAYVSFNGAATGPINTYSGGTYILQGRVSQPTERTFGYGPVYIVSGGQCNPGKATATGVNITNDFYIEGSGTVENQGMGAFRMFGNAGVTIGAVTTGTKLTGKITLTGNASVCANGDVTGGIGIGGGKITGPGGFMLGSPTFAITTSSQGNNGAGGVFTVGDVAGLAIPNDYAGDTTISGSACAPSFTANSVGATLKIFTAADNNIMPHGLTGSYAGGKTGNLILNATAANNGNNFCIFDLNGSTQTINGLISTAVNPTHDVIQSSTAPGTLILGDSDATATFGGILQDGSGLSLTKIGNGTETLTGANTYTGGTVVKAGTLATTTASTGAGNNYSVSNNAALGVTVATAGTTLAVNNLTFGSSGTALQLNAGTNGNPTAAIVNVTGALNLNGNVNLSLSGVGLTAGGPFTVLTYVPGSRTGSGNFVLNNSPRVVATLNDDTGSGVVTITIVSADSAVKWLGGTAGNWDANNTGNTIWKTVPSGTTTYYIENGSGNDSVLFDDSLTGTNVVNLTTTLTPQSVTVSNSTANYLFTGAGKLTGATGLTKQGTGTLTIANSGNNDFSGPIALNAGTLVISNSSALGNSLSGGGALTKNGNGTLTLSGDNSGFTGPVTVNGGTLTVATTASLATAASNTIASGATLDIGNNNVSLGLTNITVSGSGVGGNGAIINSSGYSGNPVATSFQNLTLAGPTTIGGQGRLDFRSSDLNNGSDAVLSTGGSAYKLTKSGGGILQLASVQIDNALGDLDVQAGLLGIQGNMPSLGNPASTLTVFGGATVQFNAVGSTMNKALALNDGAIVNNSAGANTYGGAVTLLGNGIFNIAGSGVTFTNTFGGVGGLSKVTGTAQMTLTASNTYTGNTTISAGTLALTEPADIRTSSTITIGSGATLDVTGRADATQTVLGGHSLTGSGTLNGSLTSLPGSTLAPGTTTAIGTLTVNGNTGLAGTNIMKLIEGNLTSDVLTVSGSLIFGGTLQVSVLSGTLQAGDSFQLFNGSFSGSFASIVPATPGPNFVWDLNTLTNTGALNVVFTGSTDPTNIVSAYNGSNLTLNWPPDHAGWRLQVQTNSLATGLADNWVTVPNSTSTNQVTVPVNANNGSVFYRMVLP